MTKRPSIDLMSLTSEEAAPMAEAIQRAPLKVARTKPQPVSSERPEQTRTENLEGLAFKVPRPFRRRFRERAAAADLKLNELLFEAFDAWEKMKGLKT